MTPDEAAEVLAVYERADLYEGLIWRVLAREGGGWNVRLHATCNDFFHYATADAEEITAADIPALRACIADLEMTGEPYYLPELFAARKRRLRPLPGKYEGMDEGTRLLFDAAGTEEERAEADRRDATFWAHVDQKIRDEKNAATGDAA